MSHLPNILVLTTEGLQTHTGGLGTYIRELSNRFRDFQDARIEFFEIPLRGEYLVDPTFDRELARLIANADIIHANDYFTGYAALLRRGKSKLVTTIHMLHQRFTYSLDDFLLSQSQIQFFENQVVNCSDLLIAVSHHVAIELASLPVRLPKLVVIHNAAGENFFAAVAPARGKELRLGIFTRLVPQKGIMEIPKFLKAMASFPVPWSLEIAGDGAGRNMLEKAIRMEGLNRNCRIHGWRKHEDLPNLCAGVDYCLSFSKYEPFGISYLEALATGTPIVGSIIGGMREYCQSMVNCFDVPDQQPQKFVEALKIAQERKIFSRDSVRDSVTMYRWNDTAAATATAYVSLLG